MDNSVLIAILSISCPVLTLIIPTINSFITSYYSFKQENNKFFNNNKNNALKKFINSINIYLTEPDKMNKEKCYLSISELYCYFKIPDDFSYDDIFIGKNIDFNEVNKLIKNINNQSKSKKRNSLKNK